MRRGLTPALVTTAAGDLADAEGLEGVTIARLAAQLGVRPPSLYNHVASRDAILRAVALETTVAVAADLQEAAVGRAGEEALVAVAEAYRAYALAHPGRYAATVRAPAPDDEELRAAGAAVLTVIAAALRLWDLDDVDTIHAVRGIRAALHGFVALEGSGGFGYPADVDESFRRMVKGFSKGL